MENNLKYNASGYRDKVAERAIRAADHTPHEISELVDVIKKISAAYWIVWDKENGNNDFADCELAWTSFKSAVRIFRFRWAGMLQGDMKNKEIRIHPNQKPVALYQWIINKFAAPGDKIIDTHAGSGSCLIAAYKTQHKFLGFELDKTYYTAADKRLRDEMAQMTIFDFLGVVRFVRRWFSI